MERDLDTESCEGTIRECGGWKAPVRIGDNQEVDPMVDPYVRAVGIQGVQDTQQVAALGGAQQQQDDDVSEFDMGLQQVIAPEPIV